MFAPLTRLRSALSRLAGNVEDLAGTVAEMNAGLSGRLQLDGPDPAPAIDHELAAETKGTGSRLGRKQPA
jgi:hypothetical protein